MARSTPKGCKQDKNTQPPNSRLGTGYGSIINRIRATIRLAIAFNTGNSEPASIATKGFVSKAIMGLYQRPQQACINSYIEPASIAIKVFVLKATEALYQTPQHAWPLYKGPPWPCTKDHSSFSLKAVKDLPVQYETRNRIIGCPK